MLKNILITGSSTGIGLLTVKTLLNANYHVIATARNPQNSELSKITHPNLTLLTLDVTRQDHLNELKAYLQNTLNNTLYGLINNAGYCLLGPLEELSDANIAHQIAVNISGVISVTKMCLPSLRNAKGKLITLSSVLGYVGFPLESMYVMTKHAMEGLMESLYIELNPHGVQVCLVEPGSFKTNFDKNIVVNVSDRQSVYSQQMSGLANFRKKLLNKRGGDPQDVAAKILKLIQMKSMPLRVRVGADAHAVYLIKKLLTANVYHLCLRKAYLYLFK